MQWQAGAGHNGYWCPSASDKLSLSPKDAQQKHV